MDPFGDLFSFINKNDLKEEKEVKNLVSDTDANIRVQRLDLTKNEQICKLCEKGEFHEECTTVQKLNTRDPKNFRKNTCDKCEFTSDKKTVLRLHLEAVHLNIKKYKCSACSYASYYRPALRKHFKAIHKDGNCRIIKIGCKLCEEGEIHEECTTNTQKIKTGGKKVDGKYACDKCDYTSDKQIHLRFHIEAVHLKLKKYKCSVCSHSSYQRPALSVHVEGIHKNETCRIIKIGCSLCESNQSHTFCERKNENGEKKIDGKYACEKCDYTSDKEVILKLHNEAVHLKIKRYRCSGCDYLAYRGQDIESHIKSKHKDSMSRVLIIGCNLCEKKRKHERCMKQPRPSRARIQNSSHQMKEE